MHARFLSKWCRGNKLQANLDKTKVVHFRNKAAKRTIRGFRFDNQEVEIVCSYKYLCLVLDDYLNFEITAKYVANSATSVLGLVISKFKISGGAIQGVYFAI